LPPAAQQRRSRFFFSFGSNQDYGDATQYIAYAMPAAWGCPSATTVDKDAHTVKLRPVTNSTMRKSSASSAMRGVVAKNAATVLRLETQLPAHR